MGNVPQRSIYQYHVEFAPAIESLGVKKALVGQASDLLGQIRIFDGSQLYLPVLLKPNSGEVCSWLQYTHQDYIPVACFYFKLAFLYFS